MRVVGKVSKPGLSTVYIGEFGAGRLVEFVEALQPPYAREERWILMVSTLFGCPVKCVMCDAGGDYSGKLTKEEIFEQIDYMVTLHFSDRKIPCEKFKIQFARMGEPAYNSAVLDVLEEFDKRYEAPNFIASISTIAPRGTEAFFERLTEIKERKYKGKRFQLQFSIHTTDEEYRDKIIPVKKWSLREIGRYGENFVRDGDRKVTLNFALAKEFPMYPKALLNYFDPKKFLIKVTPLNPTVRAFENRLTSYIDPTNPEREYKLVEELNSLGYDVILSLGNVEENIVGSNCGQYVLRAKQKGGIEGAYLCDVKGDELEFNYNPLG